MGGEAAGDGVSVSFECAGEGEGQVAEVGFCSTLQGICMTRLSRTVFRQTKTHFSDIPILAQTNCPATSIALEQTFVMR